MASPTWPCGAQTFPRKKRFSAPRSEFTNWRHTILTFGKAWVSRGCHGASVAPSMFVYLRRANFGRAVCVCSTSVCAVNWALYYIRIIYEYNIYFEFENCRFFVYWSDFFIMGTHLCIWKKNFWNKTCWKSIKRKK